MKQLIKPGCHAEEEARPKNFLETDAAYHTPKAKSISIASALKVVGFLRWSTLPKIARGMFLTSIYNPLLACLPLVRTEAETEFVKLGLRS